MYILEVRYRDEIQACSCFGACNLPAGYTGFLGLMLKTGDQKAAYFDGGKALKTGKLRRKTSPDHMDAFSDEQKQTIRKILFWFLPKNYQKNV